MSDIAVVVMIACFFALCVAYVRWCDHIIGPDAEVIDSGDVPSDVEPRSADDEPLPHAVVAQAVRS